MIPIELLDPAKKCADAMNEAMMAGVPGWVAIKLSDGTSDGRVYEDRADAIRFQLHERQCMYLQVQRLPMPIPDAAHLLKVHRGMDKEDLTMAHPEDRRKSAH